jgi:hypothetical protein
MSTKKGFPKKHRLLAISPVASNITYHTEQYGKNNHLTNLRILQLKLAKGGKGMGAESKCVCVCVCQGVRQHTNGDWLSKVNYIDYFLKK